jgi:hypothetical protein
MRASGGGAGGAFGVAAAADAGIGEEKHIVTDTFLSYGLHMY